MPERGPRSRQFAPGDRLRHDADARPRDLHPAVQPLGERLPVVGVALLVELRRHHGQRLGPRVPLRQVLRHRVGHPRVRLRRRLRARAEGVRVRVAVPLAVADVLELKLEGAHPERPHRVELAVQRLDVVVGRHAHRLPGGHGPAERHMAAAGPFGERAEVGAPVRRVRFAPAGLAVRVVAGRVEVPVLLGTGHEVDLGQALSARPRLPVEALGHAAHRRSRPVADHGPGYLPAVLAARGGRHQLTQRLGGVEEAVVADAVERDRLAAFDEADGDPVSPGRQIGALRRAQGAQRVLRAGAARPYDQAARGQRLTGSDAVQRLHTRVAQQLFDAWTAYGSVPGSVTSTASRPTRTGCPAARIDCGRGHTAGRAVSLSRSCVVAAGVAGAVGSGSEGAANAPCAPPSSPPMTATATAVAPLLRPNCTAVSSVASAFSCGPRAHHPSARVSIFIQGSECDAGHVDGTYGSAAVPIG